MIDHHPELILDKNSLSVSGNKSQDILKPHPDTSERS